MSKASDESKDFRMKVAQGRKERDITWIRNVRIWNETPVYYEARKASCDKFIKAERAYKKVRAELAAAEDKFLWACHNYVSEGALYR
jgi:hypothetical protein